MRLCAKCCFCDFGFVCVWHSLISSPGRALAGVLSLFKSDSVFDLYTQRPFFMDIKLIYPQQDDLTFYTYYPLLFWFQLLIFVLWLVFYCCCKKLSHTYLLKTTKNLFCQNCESQQPKIEVLKRSCSFWRLWGKVFMFSWS